MSNPSWLFRASPGRVFGAAVLLAVTVRLAFALGYWVDRPLTVDQIEYLMLADNLRSGEGLVYDEGEHRLMRSPGYPVFLAGVLSVWDSLVAVQVVQSVLGGLAVLLVAALAHRLTGSRAARVAALIAALYPPLVWMPAYMLSETLFSILGLSTAVFLWRALDRTTAARPSSSTVPWPFLGIGGLAGLAVLTRPEFLLFVGFVGLMLLAGGHVRALVGLALGTMLVVAPWTASNYMREGEIILVSSRGGPNFWLGNSALASGDGGAGDNPALTRAYDALGQDSADLSPVGIERRYYSEAFSWIRDHPVDWMVLEAKKLFYFWVPVGPSYRSHSRLYWFGHATSYLALLPFAVAGVARILRRSDQPTILWALAGTTLLTSLVFFPLARYRIPLFDPVMIVCASVLAHNER